MEERAKPNRAQRRAMARDQRPAGNNRKGTKGRVRQVVDKMVEKQTKFGTITIPSGNKTQINHSNVNMKVYQARAAQMTKIYPEKTEETQEVTEEEKEG